jgi:hypothetical protein
MSNTQTSSDLMVKQQINSESTLSDCVLPHTDIQKFLLELIDQASFQGRMVEFVSNVKNVIKFAKIKGA